MSHIKRNDPAATILLAIAMKQKAGYSDLVAVVRDQSKPHTYAARKLTYLSNHGLIEQDENHYYQLTTEGRANAIELGYIFITEAPNVN